MNLFLFPLVLASVRVVDWDWARWLVASQDNINARRVDYILQVPANKFVGLRVHSVVCIISSRSIYELVLICVL